MSLNIHSVTVDLSTVNFWGCKGTASIVVKNTAGMLSARQ